MTDALSRGTTMPRRHHIPASGIRVSLLLAIGVLGVIASFSSARATVLTVSDPFLWYYNVGPNDLDFASGEFIRYGATSVLPNGGAVPPTTGTATTINQDTGQTITRTMTFVPAPVAPNFFGGELAICTTNCTASGNNNPANLTGPWSITFTNPSTTPTSVSNTLSLAAGAGEIPFVNSITLSGTSANPTFGWSPPANITVDGYRINHAYPLNTQ